MDLATLAVGVERATHPATPARRGVEHATHLATLARAGGTAPRTRPRPPGRERSRPPGRRVEIM
ncbi:MAG: hypothetical protein ACXV3S_02170 [Kineosporiaceae bacterium]